MCRNIKPLFNFDPVATKEEIDAASLQFIRKISGFQRPSKVNEKAFKEAVQEISEAAEHLLITLKTSSPLRDREIEKQKLLIRNEKRFGRHN